MIMTTEAIINGGFELGNLTGWSTNDGTHVTVSNSSPHTGTYSAKLDGSGFSGPPSIYILQTGLSVARDTVNSFGFYAKSGYNLIFVYLGFSDNTTSSKSSWSMGYQEIYYYYNLLTVKDDGGVNYLFPSGKTLVSIKIMQRANNVLYVDDVSLLYTLPVTYNRTFTEYIGALDKASKAVGRSKTFTERIGLKDMMSKIAILTGNHPMEKVMINDVDLTNESLSSEVVLIENGIAKCTLHANDDMGQNYLNNLVLMDEVTVKYWYDEDGEGSAVTVFDGFIQELYPSLSIQGEIVSAVAYGHGYWMKQMKVANTYSFVTGDLGVRDIEVSSYSNVVDENWQLMLTEEDYPYLDIRSGEVDTGYTTGIDGYHYLRFLYPHPEIFIYHHYVNIVVNSGNLGSKVGNFGFGVTPLEQDYLLNVAELHIHGVNNSANANIQIRAYGSLDGGTTWLPNPLGTVTINHYWLDAGDGHTMDKVIDISSIVYLYSQLTNFVVKLELSGYDLTDFNTAIGFVYLMVGSTGMSNTEGLTVRQILCGGTINVGGTDYTLPGNGMISDYVDNIGILPTPISSGYPTLNTDYVYGYLDVAKLGYQRFLYQESLMAMQDVIRLGCAARYQINPSDWTGLHWIVDNNGDILVAPVGNHNVAGKDGSHMVSAKWPTYAITESEDHMASIIAKTDMISDQFKLDIPKWNFVLVSGKFQLPSDDLWCESVNGWIAEATGQNANMDNSYAFFDSDIFIMGTGSIKMNAKTGTLNPPANHNYFRPFHADDPAKVIDFTKLIGGPRSKVDIMFEGMTSSTSLQTIRLYCVPEAKIVEYNNSYHQFPWPFSPTDEHGQHSNLKNGSNWVFVNPDGGLQDYFERDISAELSSENEFFSIDVPVTSSDVVTRTGHWNPHGGADWSKVNFIGFTHKPASSLSDGNLWIDDLNIQGVVIRGAYTQDSVTTYGCRMLSLKDSMAYTDSLSEDDDTGPLAQLCLYELLRGRIPVLTGSVVLPMYAIIKPGQLIHVYANLQSGGTYKIDIDMRITKVTHRFAIKGALTEIALTSDIQNSIPIDTKDPYSILVRTMIPDSQSRTHGSLRTEGGDFDLGLKPIIKEYTL